MTLVLVTLPRLPLGNDDDSSWSAVMDYAHQKGLQFGTEIAFSYGPLGFLITPYYSPSSPWLRFGTDLFLTLMVTAGYSLLAWRMPRWWRVAALALFALFASNADPRSELLLDLGLLSWSLLCLLDLRPGESPTVRANHPELNPLGSAIALTAFAILAIFCALAKMTLLFPAAFGLAAIGACSLLQGRRKQGVGLMMGTAAGFVLTWLCLGQNLSHLGPYFLNGIRLSAAYDGTMWADPYPGLKWAALVMLALVVGAVALCFGAAPQERREATAKWSGVMAGAWLCGFLFVIWKHGFVRAGRDHVEVFFGFVPSLALALEAWPLQRRSRRLWVRGLALTCCLVAVFALRWLFAGNLAAVVTRPFRLAWTHTGNLAAPLTYQHQLKDLQQAERAANQLPHFSSQIGRSRVDVFGCNQA
ncbi:MAG TPA: hypothetical protein VHI52_02210, partial [Verrucomicrobiae bacterium]|nr:hypothetical protein [Verrucomicrobiae bacterium]